MYVTFVLLSILTCASSIAKSIEKDDKNRVKMGVLNSACDDGKAKIEVDWKDDPRAYVCYNPREPILPVYKEPKLHCDSLPKNYMPLHFCMNETIKYNSTVPTYGDHRPIWPKFGEYEYVPPQRWLHNIEHGAVVMLYHPCTHHAVVDELRQLVKGCIRKHVITPYNEIPEERPLSLVAWGCHLSMSYVDKKTVFEFIRSKGLHGPEGMYPKEGQYTYKLKKLAIPPKGSDLEDSKLCPQI
ncbi:uncharacterized protein [Lepeophtheirus salmonis]|uniref:uncharacterized protein n=1 Tax=Lepeophtheirus salmonis TaxID=72036 RepID=UPI001AE43FBA|nr:uncharacterized protein LOC121128723 [Lepeophtheirus salmonis]